jgi:putative sterol carrier protein
MLRIFGAFSVGELTSIAVGPGEFLGKEAVEARAKDLARDLAHAVREGRRFPATCDDLEFWQFMGKLVYDHRDFMKSDHEHWKEHGLYEDFAAYVGQTASAVTRSPEMRGAWLKELMKRNAQTSTDTRGRVSAGSVGPTTAKSARDLLEMMPLGLDAKAAAGLEITYQFRVTNGEDFTAHLTIQDGEAVFHEGPANEPHVTITTPAEVWLAIAQGRLDGAQAFMSGKYKVEGDVGLLMKLNTLFPK